MKPFIVTYDLVGTGETSAEYQLLIDEIKRSSRWGKVAKSAWIIGSNESSAELRDRLRSKIDPNDRLFVGRLSGEAAWIRTICDDTWLKNILTS